MSGATLSVTPPAFALFALAANGGRAMAGFSFKREPPHDAANITSPTSINVLSCCIILWANLPHVERGTDFSSCFFDAQPKVCATKSLCYYCEKYDSAIWWC